VPTYRHDRVILGVEGVLPHFLGRHVRGEDLLEAGATSDSLLFRAIARGLAEFRRKLR
jgi:hypothetical protein